MADPKKAMDLLLQFLEEATGHSWHVDKESKNEEGHLIAKGVTVQTPKKPRQPTDLTGKCGSCAYARPTTAFGGSKCYVVCTHPKRRHVKHVEYPRQRTCKACRMYKPLHEPPKEESHADAT